MPCVIDQAAFFVSLTKDLINQQHSSAHRCLLPFFQTLTEVRKLLFPEVFSKNNVQEVSGSLLPPSVVERKLSLNQD